MLILALDSASSGCHVCLWRGGSVIAAASEPMERGQDARLIPLVMEVMAQARLREASEASVPQSVRAPDIMAQAQSRPRAEASKTNSGPSAPASEGEQNKSPQRVLAAQSSRAPHIMDFSEIDRVAVTRGPGSFTGLRIGLAAARGIGLAAQKPVIGIDRFAIYRALHAEVQSRLIILESKRAELFCQFGDQQPVMLLPEEIAATYAGERNLTIVGDAAYKFQPLLPSAKYPPEPGHAEIVMCATLAEQANPDDINTLPRPLYLRAPDVTMQKDKSA